MRKIAITLTLALILTIGGCTALVLLVGGAGLSQAAADCLNTTDTTATTSSSTTGTPEGTSTPGHLPHNIGAYKGAQITNAAQIILAAQKLGISPRGQAIGVMTAIGESGLIVLDHGDSAGPDSRGLFQQRANGAWGSLADRMNPFISATNFFKALLKVDGWDTLAPTLAAHRVQANADPYFYEKFWGDGVQIVSVLDGLPDLASLLPATGELSCSPTGGGSFTGPGGTFAPQACSVIPDPSTGRGCLTPRMLALETQLKAQGWRLSCWDAHAWNPTSDHPLGRACDVFPGKGGVLPTAAQKARGDALVAALQASAKQTGVHYLIWYGRIWDIERAHEGWRTYNGGGVYDPHDITGGHYDHIHISVY